MPIIEVPNYGQVEFPDGMTDEQIAMAIQQNMPNAMQKSQSTPNPTQSGYMQDAGNFLAGAARGAGSIGATLLSPIDYLARQANQGRPIDIGGYDIVGQDRRAGMEQGLRTMGADTESGMYQVGKIGAELAGTAGVGGAAGSVLSGLSKTPRALQMAEAVRTGGLGSNLGTGYKLAGGASQGAIGSLLIDPSTTTEGAAVGAAFPAVGIAAPKVGGAVADLVGGLGTFTGGESLKTAAMAGLEGGDAARTFTQNMRGQVPMTDVLDTAKANLQSMIQQRGQAYKSGMVDISKDKTVLDIQPIVDALGEQSKIGTFKGKVLNKSTVDTQQALKDIVNDWSSANPAEYHTPEGFDALKRAISDVRESTPFGTPSRKVADAVYNSVKTQINKQAPTYSKVMSGYSESSDLINEIQRALSLGEKASADTAMRKLQSLTRNNVNTNYGNRLDLARALQEQGGGDILNAVSGQALSSFEPRGLGKALAGAVGIGGAATMNPLAIPILGLQSPRLMGETSLLSGQIARALKPVGRVTSKASGATGANINN